jgi:glycosyltransferase involved in cell wall biosynthesis
MSSFVGKPTPPENRSVVSTEATPIAYIVSRFPKLTETFILREMLEMERQGQPIIILPLLRIQQPIRHAEAAYLMSRVHYTPFLSLSILAANLHYLRRSPRAYLKALWSALKGTWGSAEPFIGAIAIFPKSAYFARMIEEQEIQHVHAHFASHPALAALIIRELTGIGFSFTAHAHDIFVYKRMLAEKINKACFVVAISEFNKEYLLRMCGETAVAKIKVIRCGIELERYRRQQGCLKGDRFTILCVGSLQPYKGTEYLVKACALLRSRLGTFRCLIVGEGKERKHLERLISDLELNEVVYLLGGQPQDKVASLLAETDLFVLPSVVAAHGQMEGIPVALMEAMASDLPVVTTRLSGIPELVQDGVTGLLVPPGEERALADAVALLYQRVHLRQEMGHRGREKVASEFQLATNVGKLRSLFSVIIGQGSEMRNWEAEMKEQIRERESASTFQT